MTDDSKPRDLDTFALYLQDLKTQDLLTRDDEQHLARQILQGRRALWEALLNLPTLHATICDAIEVRLVEATDEVAAVLQRVRTARTKEHKRLPAEVSPKLATLDPDDILADLLCADLERLVRRERGALLAPKAWPRGQVFVTYLDAVRRALRDRTAAEQAFARGNLRLVVAIARRYQYALSLEDAIQEGNLGLMKAIKRFDPERGFRFSTYGSWWISHAIRRALGNKSRVVRLPVHMMDAALKLGHAERRFRAHEGRAPTDEELAQVSKMSVKRVQRVRTCAQPATSLDAPIELEGGERKTLRDHLEDEAEPNDHQLAARQEEQILRESLSVLTEQERQILALRTGMTEQGGEKEELTLKQVGERMRVSRERIRQIQEVALAKLRDEFRRRGVEVT